METTMHALCLEHDQLVYRDDQPVPVPGPGEALIRVTLAGICGTDLELLEGYTGFRGVLGHEFVGVVESPRSWRGRRVVAEINIAPPGHQGDARHAPGRQVLGVRGRPGCFADYVCLPLENLHVVPDEVSDDAAVFVEPLAAALRLPDRVFISPRESLAVLGAGRLGLLVALVLALNGSDVHLLCRAPHGLERARQFGLAARLVDDCPDNQYRLTVDATGSPQGLAAAIRVTQPLGVVALKSTFHGLGAVDTSAVVVKELSLIGTRCGPFEPALRLLQRGALDVTRMIDAEYPLSQGVAAFRHAAAPGVLKVLLRPTGGEPA